MKILSEAASDPAAAAAAAPSNSTLSCSLIKTQAGPVLCSFSEPPGCASYPLHPHPEGWATFTTPIRLCTLQGGRYPGCPDPDLLRTLGAAEGVKGEWPEEWMEP